MALCAEQAVHAIAARIAPSASAAYTDRAWPIADDQLPVWKVYATDEEHEAATIGDLVDANLIVECRGIVKAVTGLDSAMNALVAAALPLIHGSGFAGFTVLVDASIARGMAQDNGADVAVITLRLHVTYQFHASTPEVFS